MSELQAHPLIRNALHGMDAVSFVAIGATIMKVVPPIAAVLGLCWYCLQIYWGIKDRANRKKYRRRKADLEPIDV